jgi:hypothetical protein
MDNYKELDKFKKGLRDRIRQRKQFEEKFENDEVESEEEEEEVETSQLKLENNKRIRIDNLDSGHSILKG